jgi:Ankyrin repeats (3 copies)
MSPQDFDKQDDELIERYQRASGSDARRPSDATRAAILAEGRRMAEQFAKRPVLKGFDTLKPAANQPRWRLAAFGSFGVALFAVVLMLPYWREPPGPLSAPSIVEAPASSAPAPTEVPQTPVADQSLQETVVTGSRQQKPKAAPLAKKAEQPASNAQSNSQSASLDARAVVAGVPDVATPSAPANVAPAPNVQAELAPVAAPTMRAQEPPGDLQEIVVTQAKERKPKAAALARSADKPSNDAAAAPPAMFGAAAAPQSLARLRTDALLPAALLAAVTSGDIGRVQAVLDQGGSTKEADGSGRSPLFLAVIQGRADLVRLLLARGADANAADHSGQTPLQRAQQDNQVEIAALLAGAGAK